MPVEKNAGFPGLVKFSPDMVSVSGLGDGSGLEPKPGKPFHQKTANPIDPLDMIGRTLHVNQLFQGVQHFPPAASDYLLHLGDPIRG
jgi:hypothetical protein